MPDSVRDWSKKHGPSAVSRVEKRIARFAGNTPNKETGAAAAELVTIINASLGPAPKGKKADESAE